ncbi:MAG: peptidoglycan DD-metalloendopeptidase family protein [Treponema sp.]|nr:peptidoglycan DD-metalloendopeptidase family protein [Treponema sp.]
MAKTHKYKKIEKKIASNVHNSFISFLKKIGTFFARLFKIFDSKLTVMIVPHSQSKVINFQTNVFALCLGIIMMLGIVSSFFYFNRRAVIAGAEISSLMNKNRETLASLDELRDENTNLLQAAKRFQASLSQSLALLGLDRSNNVSQASINNGDLSSLFSSRDSVNGSVRESSDIRSLTTYLEEAVQPIEQIGKMLDNQNSLFREIPNIWPVNNPNVHISQQFGPTIHAITGQWYIHKGIDFSTWRSGDPIMATANGQVVTVGYDSSFGNHVIIRHKHGMYTRYAHMSVIRVKKGEFVNQGQIIGNIGNTGVTTGPHLHYEVHIGSDVVDPGKYINVKLSK